MDCIPENTVCLSIPFISSELVSLAHDVLNVDKELKGSGIKRDITINGLNLYIRFYGADLKRIRVALNAFLKNVMLIVRTINQLKDV